MNAPEHFTRWAKFAAGGILLFVMGTRGLPAVADGYGSLETDGGGRFAPVPKIELLGSAFGGASIIDLEGPSYNAKQLPLFGLGLAGVYSKGKSVGFGVEVSYMHSFRSNTKGFYYYGPYERLVLLPTVELSTPGRGIRFTLSGGLGLAYGFSNYDGRGFFIASVGPGARFPRSVVRAVRLRYTHGFLSDFEAFESFDAAVCFSLLKKTLHSAQAGR